MGGAVKRFTGTINFLVTEEQRDQIDRYAELHGKRRSDVMRKIVEQWCARGFEEYDSDQDAA